MEDKNYCPECSAFLPNESHKPLCRFNHMLLECQKLIVHMKIHSGYTSNGYEKMTANQQRLYDAIWQESESILEGEAMHVIAPAKCSECGQLLPQKV